MKKKTKEFSKNLPQSEWGHKWESWINHLGTKGDWVRQEILDKAILSQIGVIRAKSILDAGCGEGHLSRLLAKHGARVTGIDVVPQLIHFAQAFPSRAGRNTISQVAASHRQNKTNHPLLSCPKYIIGDILQMHDYLSKHFDALVSCCSLNNIADLNKAAMNFSRALKKNGTCIIALPHPAIVLPQNKNRNSLPKRQVAYTELISSAFKVINYYRPLSQIIEAFTATGMYLECLESPLLPSVVSKEIRSSIAKFRKVRELPHPSKLPWFVVMRFRKISNDYETETKKLDA